MQHGQVFLEGPVREGEAVVVALYQNAGVLAQIVHQVKAAVLVQQRHEHNLQPDLIVLGQPMTLNSSPRGLALSWL